ncbi:MAG: 3-phosphoshikimate 1-carboxyvinyltransferase [Candidatus Gastranaerophilales bacterium]|nr:3-phosphoshikimate 1-carboxyvinyltransferase [Candidatus Gastranaerophilales bacterium]
MTNNQANINKIVTPCQKGLKGTIEIPPDKSLSHRAAVFSALTHAKCEIFNFSSGKDCHSTLGVLKALGVEIDFKTDKNLILKSPKEFQKPSCMLDAGNSGTTIRMMSGVLARLPFDTVITGDQSLQKRPMKRIITPLEQMGAVIESNDFKAPLTIRGKKLHPIDYASPIASAQVKSCILLAGLGTEGVTSVTEPYVSRNHTEIMLDYLGADINTDGTKVSISQSELTPCPIHIAGDISSAAFFIAAALIVPNSDIIIKNVGLNPTRTGILDVFKAMGADIQILDERTVCGEIVGDIRVKTSDLKGTTIEGAMIPRLIDELPVIAVVATQANGKTIVKDAEDLRAKESDRIAVMAEQLRKMGVEMEETPDGFIIEGKQNLRGSATIDTFHDHRIAMSMYIAGMVGDSPIEICEFEWVDISFPEFEGMMAGLC